MLFDWDDAKSDALKELRGYSFEEILPVFESNFLEEPNFNYPGQSIVIGFLGLKMLTVATEERIRMSDGLVYTHLITYWETTREEEKRYGEAKKGWSDE